MTVELLVVETEHPADLLVYEKALGDLRLNVVVRTASSTAEAVKICGPAEGLIAKAHAVSAELVAAMPKLRWIQALTTGVDHLATLGLPRNLKITNMRGMHGPQMSELAFLYMIALSRDVPRMLENQAAAVWARWPQRLLWGKTAVIVGVGAISEELALRCKAFGMNVMGVSSGRRSAPGFDEIAPRNQLASAAAKADFLIVLAPLAAETRRLVGKGVLAAMRPEAVLINIARGPVVDEAALILALQEGRISGAGLDVFETEPLPPASPLWSMKNVIITPRIGGMSDVYAEQASAYLVENVRRFVAGRLDEMVNPVAL